MDRDVYQQRQNTDVTSESIHLPSWSIEQEVNGLMDDLFGDIDRALDRGGVLPTEPVQPESVAVKPLDIPSMKLPPAIAESLARSSPELASLAGLSNNEPPPALDLIEDSPRSDTSSAIGMSDLEEMAQFDDIDEIAQLDSSFFADEPIQLAEPPQPPAPSPSAPSIARTSLPWWDRLLLFTIGGAIAIPFGMWLSRQPGWEFARFKLGVSSSSVRTSAQTAAEETPRVDGQAQVIADREFAQYMQRSLQLREELQGEVDASAIAPSVDVKTEATPPQPTTVLERVYIPVYQPTSPTAIPSDSGSPAAPPPAPEPPVQNAAITPEITPPTAPAIPTPSEPAGVVLTGILELGDRSAALFEIEGVSRRFQVGEAIDSSGWTLVQIADREAIIRRNGEVRSIFVGEMF
ncbi:hypothetical protein [Roseofilum casamattae]|uniref:Type II secretion system protein GspC N-terminal domain-containing protein n=1 Tax=Roseofilum casamattae BLCC-M143 TaxID=3022442 RepID=A0ABT7BUA9_9CYAN|nr:hypothetical protein [Roseofilum casamattae]MDJ1182774.1 hypothetical protein [Roseofilum casamattae BLCC-M143]